MTCDSATPFYSLQDSNQVLSRELELQNGIEVLALNYANVDNRPYRLFIEEKNNNSVIQVERLSILALDHRRFGSRP